MKKLDIDSETEQKMIAIFDAALKASGMNIIRMINEVSAKIRNVEPIKSEKENSDELPSK